MKQSVLALSLLSFSLFAQQNYECTPQLLIETGANQRLDSSVVGTLAVEKMEAGFELGIGEKLTALTNLELCDDNTIVLNEAKVNYAFTDHFTLSAGRLVTNFGRFTSDAITDPRFKNYCETKQYAVQADVTGDHFYGGLSVYNGIITNNFASLVPALGFALDEKLDIKVALRTELLEKKTFTDFSGSVVFSPTAKLRLILFGIAMCRRCRSTKTAELCK